MLIALIVTSVVLAGAGICVFFYLQLKRNQRPPAEQPEIADKSAWGTCSVCQQHRILVKKELGLCAFCWSSMNTKQLG